MKRLFTMLAAVALIFSVTILCACNAGGQPKNTEDTKYDVTVKVVNSLGDEWIFTPEIEELTFEMEYTGEEVRFWANKYNLPDHPLWSEFWPDFYVYGQDTIDMSCLYWDPEGNQIRGSEGSHNNKVMERGKYVFTFHTNITSQLFNWRVFTLNVFVY